MDKNEKKNTNELLPVIIMAGLFVFIHGLAISIIEPFKAAGVQPTFENPDNPMNIILIFLILIVFTIIILLISKFWKKQIIQLVILGAIGYTSAFVLYPLFSLAVPNSYSLYISTSEYYWLVLPLSGFLAVFTALMMIIILYKHPEWYVLDITGILVGSGAIAIFGMSLGVLLVIILLIVLAVYDAISVYKTKHMIDLADTVMDLKLPVLLVIPKIRNYSLLRETKRLKEKIEDKEERDAFFMGLGDIVMPGILVAAVYHNIPNSLPVVISVVIGTLIGFAILMTFVMKGKPQAGLPLLCSGAILGYIVSSLIFFGELKGLTLAL